MLPYHTFGLLEKGAFWELYYMVKITRDNESASYPCVRVRSGNLNEWSGFKGLMDTIWNLRDFGIQLKKTIGKIIQLQQQDSEGSGEIVEENKEHEHSSPGEEEGKEEQSKHGEGMNKEAAGGNIAEPTDNLLLKLQPFLPDGPCGNEEIDSALPQQKELLKQCSYRGKPFRILKLISWVVILS